MRILLTIAKTALLALVWVVVGVAVLVAVLPQVPTLRSAVAEEASSALSEQLGTAVTIGGVTFRSFNQLIIDDVVIEDEEGGKLLLARRLAAGIDLVALLRGQIVVTSVQILSATVDLHHSTADGRLNAQFLIDALSSSDSTGTSTLDLRVNTILIRRSTLHYEDKTVSDISAYATLRTLTADSLNIGVRRLAMKMRADDRELTVDRLSLNLAAGSGGWVVSDLSLQLPRSTLTCSSLAGDSTHITPTTLHAVLTPADLTLLAPFLEPLDVTLTIDGNASLTHHYIDIPRLHVTTAGLTLDASGWLHNAAETPTWGVTIDRLEVNKALPATLSTLSSLRALYDRTGDIMLRGTASSTSDDGLTFAGAIATQSGSAALRIATRERGGTTTLSAQVDAKRLNLDRLTARQVLGMLSASGTITLPLKGDLLNTFAADMAVTDITLLTGGDTLSIDRVNIAAGMSDAAEHYINISSSIGQVSIAGTLNPTTLIPTLMNSATAARGGNAFSLSAQVLSADWLRALAGVPLTFDEPLTLNASINDAAGETTLFCDIPRLTIAGHELTDCQAMALDSGLAVTASWERPLQHGTANAVLSLRDDNLTIDMLPSSVTIADTAWTISNARVTYGKGGIAVDSLVVANGNQYIVIDGRASAAADDTLKVELNDINVEYILDLVNFHAVTFSGTARATAHLSSLMSSSSPLQAAAFLEVSNFCFEGGRMGTLHAGLTWNPDEKRLELSSLAQEDYDSYTNIYGTVTTSPGYLDLTIDATNTNIEFLHSFTGSFMDNIIGQTNGSVNVFGPLSDVNLRGLLVVDGEADITPLNTHYTLMGDTIVAEPDEIEFRSMPIFDKHGNMGIVSGYLHHKSLRRLTYDVNVEAHNLLAYDFRDFGDEAYYGTVYGTGNVDIHGRSGELLFNIDVTPNAGTQFVYNVSSPDAITYADFITWRSKSSVEEGSDSLRATSSPPSSFTSSDMHINFLINCTPDATIRLLMDEGAGDYITLRGNGTLRANYYNKGAFNLFGTYEVESGTYDITIQELMKKSFTFNEGGTLMFGGNPFDASLNLQAVHAVNGVSLSDLSIGNSYSTNTVRVNCLMNIGGIARSPLVDFDIDIPQVSTDQKQMIRSVINSEEEMSRQVVYLLAIGRFYPKESNTSYASEQQKSNVSLAAQSLLSGTISQQINSLLGTMIDSDNWSFGANIATGNDGWDNAEYEGIVSGRLLNNRLLIDGQFGYRDNATNDNSSFIGDFDIKYLLVPNGNVAVNVYNKTNDRYFVENSLNTQGIGLILKRDFSSLKDLFGK